VNEKRGEPRFPVTSPIRVVLPGDGGHTIDSTLIDISGTGMRFLAPESLEAENVVGIEVDSRLILAEVRYCQPRGTRFVVGARRLHEIAKDAQLSDAPAVVSEMLGHLRRHLAAANAADSQSIAVEALEKIVERREHPLNTPPELAQQGHPVDTEIVAEPIQEKYPEPPSERSTTLDEPQPVEKFLPELVKEEPSEPERAPEPVAVAQVLLPKRQLPPVDSLEAVRQALGAEFERAARQPAVRRRRLKTLHVALVLAASLLVAALLGYLLYQRQTDAKTVAPAAAEPAPIIAAAPPNLQEVHHAQVRMLKSTWVSLAIDGGDPLKSVFQANDTHPFDFSKGATLRVADGAAVEITVDGNPAAPIGPGPQIVQISSRGVEVVK
jgi:hypothetical protein